MNINNNKTLSVYPYIEEIGYSDPISSEKLNKQFESLRESVLRSIIRTQEINSTLEVYEEAFNAQAISLGNYYNSLTRKLNDTMYHAYVTSHDSNIKYKNINYDTAYGYTTLGLTSKYSKIPRNEGYNGKVSPDVKIFINGTEQTFDTAPFKALDGSLKTVWFKQYAPNTDIEFEIVLPQTLTKRFNYIEINPFPIFSYKINEIFYQNLYGVDVEITNQIVGTFNPLSSEKCTPLKIYVSPKEFNGVIKIKATTDSLGYFGFSNIDVAFMDFNNTTSECYMLFQELLNITNSVTLTLHDVNLGYYFDAPNAEALLKGSTPVLDVSLVVARTVINPDGSTTINPLKEIKLDIADGKVIELHNATVTVNSSDRLYLHVKFTEHNMTTPVIRGAKLRYKRS